MNTLLSVVMSTYNRGDMLPQAIDSILSQTFSDFEFLIIDDCSNDNTIDILSSYNDSRIKILKNRENKGCTFNYHVAHNIAKGRYIAHIDDDDISLPLRFERQIEFLNDNENISLLGTFIETFGENKRPSWVFYTEPELLDLTMNVYNPICHSSIIYDKHFFDRNGINYNLACKCAQDYDLYKQIIFKGGKLANLPEVLVQYRMHQKRLTDIFDTQQIQINVAEDVKKQLLLRVLSEEEIVEFTSLITDFPYNNYDLDNVVKAFRIIKDKKYYDENIVEKVIVDIKNNLFKF